MGARLLTAAMVTASLMLGASTAGAASPPATSCPGTFQVLNSDRIGPLGLPAGPYAIAPSGGVGCAEAATLFTRFLQDWDGVLPGGWKVAGKGFRRQGSAAAFTVTPAS